MNEPEKTNLNGFLLIDKPEGITSRKVTNEGLVLIDKGTRPQFQEYWDLEAPPVLA